MADGARLLAATASGSVSCRDAAVRGSVPLSPGFHRRLGDILATGWQRPANVARSTMIQRSAARQFPPAQPAAEPRCSRRRTTPLLSRPSPRPPSWPFGRLAHRTRLSRSGVLENRGWLASEAPKSPCAPCPPVEVAQFGCRPCRRSRPRSPEASTTLRRRFEASVCRPLGPAGFAAASPGRRLESSMQERAFPRHQRPTRGPRVRTR